MLPKIKKFIKNNKRQVKIGVIILIVIVLLFILYKSIFYSNSEKATYGVRLRDIKENKLEKEEIAKIKEKSSDISGVEKVDIKIKGRLIKFFVTFEDGMSNDDIKNKFNDMLSFISEKVTGYYDITFYAEKLVDGKPKYPVTGYKHKNRSEISFDVL